MTDSSTPSVSHRRSLFVWALFCVLAGIMFLVYALASWVAGHGEFVMPLDDVYIHFQYAKQMALGQPYIYNPGLPPTSGATSFLYPYLLAVGYLFGFQGLNLGLWAMLLGMVALACSTWLVYRLVLARDAPAWLAILFGVVFALSGPVSWHFMSGMETGPVILFTLWTLYSLLESNTRSPIFAASLSAIIRPELGILAGLSVIVLLIRARRAGKRPSLSLFIPILAIGAQPLVNLLLTGSAVASGNAAKSVFGIVPFYWDEVIRRVLDTWARMWAEFLSGGSPREGLYITPLMLVVAGIGLIALLRDRRRRIIGLMLIGWLLFGTLAISTLDTAFWHFKRYQMPFVALLFPLAGWGLVAIGNVWRSVKRQSGFLRDPGFIITPNVEWGLNSRIEVLGIFVAVGIAYTMMTSFDFLSKYALNVGYVYQQPLQMARWLEANTPLDAVIAVHDVGMMRYMGGRTTLDMVGLTTPGAAEYWRNGPGSVAEFLIQQRPDYIASYGHGHGFGLGMLADTSLYSEPLASFPVDLDDNFNVALAANFQGIYRPEWETPAFRFTDYVLQANAFYPLTTNVLGETKVNVGDLKSEAEANYFWQNSETSVGFPTEVHELDYSFCVPTLYCHPVDGGRRINGEESFELYTGRIPANDSLGVTLVTRLHPMTQGTLDIYANGEFIKTRLIPAFPGQWLEIATQIPAVVAFKNGNRKVSVRIVPHILDGYYMPFYHWLYPTLPPESEPDRQLTNYQDGAIELSSAEIIYFPDKRRLAVFFEWYTDGTAIGNYKLFVHILDEDNQIVAQQDAYPGLGTLPPGNWSLGVLRDSIDVDLEGVSPGSYRVAIGLYDPYTFERLQPAGGDEQDRFFIGAVEIE